MRSQVTDCFIITTNRSLMKFYWGHIEIVYPLIIEYYHKGKLCQHTIDGPKYSGEHSVLRSFHSDDDTGSGKPQENQEQLLR